jgi:agmatinase
LQILEILFPKIMIEQSSSDPNSHFQPNSTQAGRALEKEAHLPLTGW